MKNQNLWPSKRAKKKTRMLSNTSNETDQNFRALWESRATPPIIFKWKRGHRGHKGHKGHSGQRGHKGHRGHKGTQGTQGTVMTGRTEPRLYLPHTNPQYIELAFLTYLYLSRAGFSSPRDQWGVLIHYYVKNDANTFKTNQKMLVGKRDVITFCFFLKKTWIEENADWIWSAETLSRVFVWVSPLKTLKCIQTKTQRLIQ